MGKNRGLDLLLESDMLVVSILAFCMDRSKLAQQDAVNECQKVLNIVQYLLRNFSYSTTRVRSVLALQTA